MRSVRKYNNRQSIKFVQDSGVCLNSFSYEKSLNLDSYHSKTVIITTVIITTVIITETILSHALVISVGRYIIKIKYFISLRDEIERSL